jgi:alpha-D-ribose 1-methylphosphonate 5-triphosphate synthase subunit PhnH
VTGSLVLGVHASQRTFRSLLDSLANPGKVLYLHEPAAVAAGAGVVALALADIDTPVAIVGDEELAAEVSESTRAPLVPVSEARLVGLVQPTAELVRQCPKGSALAPELGAKVGMACTRLAADPQRAGEQLTGGQSAGTAQAALGLGGVGNVVLQLRGPGVDGTRRVLVEGAGRELFEALSGANSAFPVGIDTWLVDKEGRLVGLPRSTTIEVV